MNWNTRRGHSTILNIVAIGLSISFVIAAIAMGLWLLGGKSERLDARMVTQERIKDRRGNVGQVSVAKINLYEHYVDSLRDDMDGAKATISDLDERFKVINSKLGQLEKAFDEEKKRAESRYRSIWAEYNKFIATIGGYCR